MNISYFDLDFMPWQTDPDVYGESAALFRTGHGFDRWIDLVVTVGDGVCFWEVFDAEDEALFVQGLAPRLCVAKQAAETAAMRMFVERAA